MLVSSLRPTPPSPFQGLRLKREKPVRGVCGGWGRRRGLSCGAFLEATGGGQGLCVLLDIGQVWRHAGAPSNDVCPVHLPLGSMPSSQATD